MNFPYYNRTIIIQEICQNNTTKVIGLMDILFDKEFSNELDISKFIDIKEIIQEEVKDQKVDNSQKKVAPAVITINSNPSQSRMTGELKGIEEKMKRKMSTSKPNSNSSNLNPNSK